jgi:hypothetical protein
LIGDWPPTNPDWLRLMINYTIQMNLFHFIAYVDVDNAVEANNYCSADDWKESTPMIGDGESEKKAL